MRLNSYLWQMTLRGLQNLTTTCFKSSYFIQSMKYYFNSYLKEQVIFLGVVVVAWTDKKVKIREGIILLLLNPEQKSLPLQWILFMEDLVSGVVLNLGWIVFIIPVHRRERQILLDLSTSPWCCDLHSQIICTACTTVLVSYGGTSHH